MYDKSGKNPIYTNPIANQAVAKAELYSTQGLQALYDADNMRTVVGNIFQTVVSVTPTGSLRKGASMFVDKAHSRYLSKQVGYATKADAAGRVTAEAVGNSAARETTK